MTDNITDNINLKSSDSITLNLNIEDDTLSIEINKTGLDALIAALVENTDSATHKAIKKMRDSFDFAAKSHKHTVANITDLNYGTGTKTGTIFIKYEK